MTRERVELTLADRNELREVWMRDISKGGLFVATDDPPPLRALVRVTLATPDGSLTLSAEVVHVVDADAARPGDTTAGMGLQFVDLDANRRAAIEAYVEGLMARLAAEDSQSAKSPDAAQILAVVNQVLRGYEEEDVYAALGVHPLAPQSELDREVDELCDLLGRTNPDLTVAQASRATHVRHLVRRLAALLSDPDRRFDYDLRHGHLHPRERMARIDDRERERIRRRWHQSNPTALAQAEKHATLALRYEGIMKYEEAVEAAKLALEHDPFNYDLWQAIDTWQERLRLADEVAPAHETDETAQTDQ